MLTAGFRIDRIWANEKSRRDITQQAVSDHVNAAICKIATLNRRKEVA
ncbi:hypothetical protein FTV88_2225 [Heliorestis convoluta]|uniref:Uncharacterized protein n=1 Tax=Heliorestis convoluta TaxID=356322 RepID=A0A5Q2N372_9FIRM|nr:hypothetical protein FTV88_2225 [Heliorestis convoluta]